jgi:hypothetical protein
MYVNIAGRDIDLVFLRILKSKIDLESFLSRKTKNPNFPNKNPEILPPEYCVGEHCVEQAKMRRRADKRGAPHFA